MTIVKNKGLQFAVADKSLQIVTVQDMLDLIVSASYGDCDGLIVHKENLTDDFFNLKTGLAGEMLQKCSNYHAKFAVIGDFAQIQSKSLRDFIYECNNGNLVFFKSSLDEAMAALSK